MKAATKIGQKTRLKGFVRILCIFAAMTAVLISGCSNPIILEKPPMQNEGTQPPENTDTQPSGSESTQQSTGETSPQESTTPSAIENQTEDSTGAYAGDEPKKAKVKALYLTGWTVGSEKNLRHYAELANTTELNSYVIDIKDDDGFVGYKSEVPEVLNSGTWKTKYNVDHVLDYMHENDIHVIGRLVCFKDPQYAAKNPDLAIKTLNGDLWRDSSKSYWLNPYNKKNWEYLAKIAKEAVAKGFDEIQFDYVRFPSEGNKKNINYEVTGKEKYEAINEFLAYMRKELPRVILSADVFGIVCESPGDREDIGQYLELIGKDIDYISPMVYPSHYALGQVVNGIKFAKPDHQPYQVVYNSLIKAKNRISAVPDYKAGVRPYLQDFTASWLKKGNYIEYGPQQVREQIKAVYDAGYDEWILWDALNTYSEKALLKQD
jgi:hypothetical protein